jgi:hypothetical protein
VARAPAATNREELSNLLYCSIVPFCDNVETMIGHLKTGADYFLDGDYNRFMEAVKIRNHNVARGTGVLSEDKERMYNAIYLKPLLDCLSKSSDESIKDRAARIENFDQLVEWVEERNKARILRYRQSTCCIVM